MSRWLPWGLRLAVSAALLAALATRLDAGAVLARLGEMQLPWVAVALALSGVQVVASAWRWRFTSHRLGVELPLGRAVGEYYLASFLNQILPGGVAGDVSRAWRHARGEEGRTRETVSAVILERASGQLVMTAVALVSAGLLLGLPGGGTGGGFSGAVALALVGLVAVSAALGWRRLRRVPAVSAFVEDARRALLARDALPIQLATSLVVVGSYVATYLVAARAVGVATPWLVLAPLVAPVLVTMLLPVSVAGWGVREAAAAALWGLVGLDASQGVAISVAYGFLVLLSTLPGAGVLAVSLLRPGGRDRREGPSPAGSAAPGDAAPGPAVR